MRFIAIASFSCEAVLIEPSDSGPSNRLNFPSPLDLIEAIGSRAPLTAQSGSVTDGEPRR